MVCAASFMNNCIVDGICYSFGFFMPHFQNEKKFEGSQPWLVALIGSILTGLYMFSGTLLKDSASRACSFFLLTYIRFILPHTCMFVSVWTRLTNNTLFLSYFFVNLFLLPLSCFCALRKNPSSPSYRFCFCQIFQSGCQIDHKLCFILILLGQIWGNRIINILSNIWLSDVILFGLEKLCAYASTNILLLIKDWKLWKDIVPCKMGFYFIVYLLGAFLECGMLSDNWKEFNLSS